MAYGAIAMVLWYGGKLVYDNTHGENTGLTPGVLTCKCITKRKIWIYDASEIQSLVTNCNVNTCNLIAIWNFVFIAASNVPPQVKNNFNIF